MKRRRMQSEFIPARIPGLNSGIHGAVADSVESCDISEDSYSVEVRSGFPQTHWRTSLNEMCVSETGRLSFMTEAQFPKSDYTQYIAYGGFSEPQIRYTPLLKNSTGPQLHM